MANLILCLLITAQAEEITVYFFYSPDCGHCIDILISDIPALQKKYRFGIKKYDITIPDHYALLEQMEIGVENKGEDLPIVFIGDSVLYGPGEFRNRLENILKSSEKPFHPVHDTIRGSIKTVPGVTGEINLHYFYQPICRECNRVEILLDHYQRLYPTIKIHRYDILEDTSKIFYEGLAEARQVPERRRLAVPALFVGGDYLIHDEITKARLDSLLIKYRLGSPMLRVFDAGPGEDRIAERFGRFSVLGIMVAGLLDGVNPCAFATLIFFVSYLIFIGRRRQDIILMAIFFIGAVFMVYLAIGLGAYNLIRYFSGFKIIAKIIFFGFGAMAIVLGILSLRDYFLAKRGEPNRMVLQLPIRIKQHIHRSIKDKTRIGGIVVGSFLAGFFVSFLEFGCTGQVYLPTITFMASRLGLSLKPLLALLIYNIMFIIPLAAIGLGALVFSTENIGKMLARRIALIKFLTAVLFFVLGALLILTA